MANGVVLSTMAFLNQSFGGQYCFKTVEAGLSVFPSHLVLHRIEIDKA